MSRNDTYTLGIDIGSTTVKIAVLDSDKEVLFSDYERDFAEYPGNVFSDLLGRAVYKLGPIHASPVITGSGGLDTCQTSWSTFCPGSDRSLLPHYRIMLPRLMLPSN